MGYRLASPAMGMVVVVEVVVLRYQLSYDYYRGCFSTVDLPVKHCGNH